MNKDHKIMLIYRGILPLDIRGICVYREQLLI